MIFQVGLGVLLAVFVYYHGASPALPHGAPVQVEAHMLNWPFFRDLTIPWWVFAVVTVIVITGSSNAVNLTDGMDGLAAGCMAIVAFAFVALALVTGIESLAHQFNLHFVQRTGELAVVCGAITGACLGFLWYNCNRPKSSWVTPARWPWAA